MKTHCKAGAKLQEMAARALDHLPLQTLINMLGQGYQVVLTGHRFGGMLAHALASKLLLQLHHDIDLAQQMGVNISALSSMISKVSTLAILTYLLRVRMLL